MVELLQLSGSMKWLDGKLNYFGKHSWHQINQYPGTHVVWHMKPSTEKQEGQVTLTHQFCNTGM